MDSHTFLHACMISNIKYGPQFPFFNDTIALFMIIMETVDLQQPCICLYR